MKAIQLATTKEMVVINGSKEVEMKITTAELIKTACNQPVQGGITAKQMVDRVRILDFLANAEAEAAKANETLEAGKEPVVGVLNLEDADYANLAKLAEATKWTVVSKTIVSFVDSFKN